MKRTVLSIIFLGISIMAMSQNLKRIQKSWIKVSTDNLSEDEIEPDMLYTRYTFDKNKLFISFYPGWDDYQQDWSLNKDDITIGFDSYHIDEITDTSLSIKLAGFRKYHFISEEYLTRQRKFLDSIGIFNGRTLYKANDIITPRYKKGQPLSTVLQKNTDGYNIKKASKFQIKFIVTEKGEVENIEVLKGITYGFDNEIITHLKRTSRHWTPAVFNGTPIPTEMLYEIKFLDSIVR